MGRAGPLMNTDRRRACARQHRRAMAGEPSLALRSGGKWATGRGLVALRGSDPEYKVVVHRWLGIEQGGRVRPRSPSAYPAKVFPPVSHRRELNAT